MACRPHRDRPQSPGRTVTSPRDGSPGPRRALGDGRPAAGGPAAPATTGPQSRHGRRPGPSADGLGEDGGLAITREAPGTRRRTAPQAGTHPGGTRRGPLRGFPPAPGQPDPVYPPGQFSPWNRASTRSAWLGIAGTGGGTADTEPGYSALAVSDAAADLTSTQAWGVTDDEPPQNPSLPARGSRDWGSHTGVPTRQRAPGDRAPGDGAPGGRSPGNQASGSRAPGRARGAGRPGAVAGELATGPQGPAGPATGPQRP